MGGIKSLAFLIDCPTMLWILGLHFLILAISGWFPNYVNAWKFALGRKHGGAEELQKSMNAVKFAGYLVLAIGIFVSVLGEIGIMVKITDVSTIGPSLAVAILSTLYTSVIEFIYGILYFVMKKRQQEMI